MAKVVFGEYAGFTTRNMIRFQKNNKLVSKASVPKEAVAFITSKLEQFIDKDEPKKEMEERVENLTPVSEAEAVEKLSKQDFDDGNDMWDEPKPEPVPLEEIDTPSHNVGFDAGSKNGADNARDEMSDFIEAVSIHTASLEDIAQSLYERFGIYTVYLNRPPNSDEVDPLTGEPFTKYHLGVAYQASIRARNSGILNKDPEQLKKSIVQGREASKNHRDMYDEQPKTVGQARQQSTFKYRTSVRGANGYGQTRTELVAEPDENGVMHSVRREVPFATGDEGNGMRSVRHPDEEEPIAEPPTRGKKTIRPNW